MVKLIKQGGTESCVNTSCGEGQLCQLIKHCFNTNFTIQHALAIPSIHLVVNYKNKDVIIWGRLHTKQARQ